MHVLQQLGSARLHENNYTTTGRHPLKSSAYSGLRHLNARLGGYDELPTTAYYKVLQQRYMPKVYIHKALR